jgi:hypothetical protein
MKVTGIVMYGTDVENPASSRWREPPARRARRAAKGGASCPRSSSEREASQKASSNGSEAIAAGGWAASIDVGAKHADALPAAHGAWR